ncbi:hypothetical protein [Burkholderia sp. 3C]
MDDFTRVVEAPRLLFDVEKAPPGAEFMEWAVTHPAMATVC